MATSHPTQRALNCVWDPNTLTWVSMRQPLLNAQNVTITNDGSFAKETGGNLDIVAVSSAVYTTQMDYLAGTNPIYIGKADPGTAGSSSVWQIRKFSYDGAGNVLSILFAGGSRSFAFCW